MNKVNFRSIVFTLIIMAITFSSCQAVGSIFKAGVWVGIIIVIVIVALIFWLISRAGKS